MQWFESECINTAPRQYSRTIANTTPDRWTVSSICTAHEYLHSKSNRTDSSYRPEQDDVIHYDPLLCPPLAVTVDSRGCHDNCRDIVLRRHSTRALPQLFRRFPLLPALPQRLPPTVCPGINHARSAGGVPSTQVRCTPEIHSPRMTPAHNHDCTCSCMNTFTYST